MRLFQPLLAVLLLLVANQLFAQGTAVITGSISNPLTDHVTLAYYPNPLLPEEEKIEVPLKGNSFELKVPVAHAVVAELLHGDELVPVYLEPDFALHLSFNGNKLLKTLKYTGQGAAENNFLADFTTRFVDEEDYQLLPDNVKLGEGEFTEFLDYRRNDQLETLEKYGSKHPLSNRFKDYLLAEIEFGYAKDKLRYHPLRQQIMQATITKPAAAFYTSLNELDLQRPANLVSNAFITFLPAYTAYFTEQAGHTKRQEDYFQKAYGVAGQKLQGQARVVAQAQVLKQSIKEGHLKYTEQLLQDFTAKNEDAALNTYLTELYQANKALALGSQAPGFTFTDLKGDTLGLHDLKGQLVYLSFLRSDCGLCQVEQPHLEQLAAKLQGQKVVILTVHLKESPQQWRAAVQNKKLQATHVYVPKQQQQELMQHYKLSDGPAYFLLDQQGLLLDADARHPNDPEVMKDILKHLTTEQASLK